MRKTQCVNFVTHLECADCGKHYPAGQPHNLCTDCHRPLWVRYDLGQLRDCFPRELLAGRPSDLWRYRELLPYVDAANVVSLGETATPILPATRLGAELGLANLQIKDESRLPTGSFKARGMAMAITMANEFGIRRVACPTAGNAGGAMAAYASRAGMESFVFMPDDTPLINVKETHLAGARVFRVNGLINDCGRLVGEGREPMGWFDLSTLKEPYRIEGKKTMGLELAEQFDWELPDWIFYPTGGGTGLIGMWKAFEELEALGWMNDGKRPKMVACQSDGCAPIVKAFESGAKHAERFENAATIASGVDTATSTPHASVNSHSLRASLMRATIRPTPNSPLASSAMARLALSSPVAAIATSQLCSCASSSDDSSQASARNQSAPGTRAGTYRVNSRSINSTL